MSSITVIVSQSNHYIDYYSAGGGWAMLIGSTHVLHFGQNKRAAGSKFIPSQGSCGVLSICPLCPIRPRWCRFLYCNLWAHVKYFSKMQHARVCDQPPLFVTVL